MENCLLGTVALLGDFRVTEQVFVVMVRGIDDVSSPPLTRVDPTFNYPYTPNGPWWLHCALKLVIRSQNKTPAHWSEATEIPTAQ